MKKQMLKSLAILLIIAMISAFIPTSKVEAANPTNPTFEITGGEGGPGDTITVNVSLKEATTFEDLVLAISYDTSKLTVESESDIQLCKTLTDSMLYGVTLEKTASVEYQGLRLDAEPFTLSAGNVMSVEFKILEGATGDANLALKYDVGYTEVATATVKIATPVEAVTLNQTSIELQKGGTSTLTATVMPAGATDSTVTWSTSNANVATVDNGVVTAVAGGTATITATAGGKSATCEVKVLSPMTGIEITDKNVELVKGQIKVLNLNYLPSDTTDSKVVLWETSDRSIVDVGAETGAIQGIKEGTATITATVNGFTASVDVTVVEYPLEGIVAWAEKEEIDINEKTTVSVATNPAETTDKVTYEYTTSDEKVATIDENGVITGVSQGTATITVIANGEFTSKFDITVTDKVVVEEESTEQTTETTGEETKTEGETTSVLPKTADIAIGTVVLVMLMAGGVAIFTIRKNKKK